MTKVLHLVRGPGASLLPANQLDADAIQSIKRGAYLEATIKQPRNPQFHRKFFAMLNFAFEYFEPEGGVWNGIQAQKNFERFRSDILILAGYREVTYNIRGEVRVEAQSISFGSMDEGEFAEVYKACFNVCWGMVLAKVSGLDRGQAENTINQMLSYD